MPPQAPPTPPHALGPASASPSAHSRPLHQRCHSRPVPAVHSPTRCRAGPPLSSPPFNDPTAAAHPAGPAFHPPPASKRPPPSRPPSPHLLSAVPPPAMAFAAAPLPGRPAGGRRPAAAVMKAPPPTAAAAVASAAAAALLLSASPSLYVLGREGGGGERRLPAAADRLPHRCRRRPYLLYYTLPLVRAVPDALSALPARPPALPVGGAPHTPPAWAVLLW